MDTVKETRQLDFSIVSPKLTVQAMRDSGYKDTDHALAELIDNSIEAKATVIEVIAIETPPDPDIQWARARISEIAVIDNGEGMNSLTLRRSLRFGDGTRLDLKKRGIGRFGIGLPNSSISQSRRVDIWTWQNGADNAFHCYLSLEDIENGVIEVPEPVPEAVPYKWHSLARSTSEPTGTLVLWTKLDRVRWRGGKTTLDRTEELCGRIYRKFLTSPDNPIQINLILASANNSSEFEYKESRSCRPNDPLYLTIPSSTPPPFSDKPMFDVYNERTWTTHLENGELGTIHVKCSMARPDAINERRSNIPWPRSYPKAGKAPWGKHADRNKGVSIVRAGRELVLSHAWINSYEPEERWWAVEVEFDPVLDEIFGVVNNKQNAHIFEGGAGFKWEEHTDPGENYMDFCKRLEETADPRQHLIQVWTWIEEQIVQMRKERKNIMKGTKKRHEHPKTGESIDDVVTNIINEQPREGKTDRAPALSRDEKKKLLVSSAITYSVEPTTAEQWADTILNNGRRVQMKEVPLGHRQAFFDVKDVNNVIEVWLNNKHPVGEHFIDLITADTTDETLQDLSDRIKKADFTLRLLLYAWARYEDKAPMEIKEQLEDTRMAWGLEARKFFDSLDL